MGIEKIIISEKENCNEKFSDPLAIKWLAKYDKQFSKIWNFLPVIVAKTITVFAVFFFGISINGDWISLYTHFERQFGIYRISLNLNNSADFLSSSWSLEYFRLNNLLSFWVPSVSISYLIYYLVGGFIHWHYYIQQRDKAELWKCQPKKWLTSELERNEIFVGSTTLFVNASFSAVFSCYISNGGYSTVYYQCNEYGWIWFILSFPVVFTVQEFLIYWTHRTLHVRFFYINFHKIHHRYKAPTAFSVTAMHPVEAVAMQIILGVPLFLIPVHWAAFHSCIFYAYYHGIIDHSGVNFKAYWWQPWQPDAIFHDNHHQYFHVNFGFNMNLWDKLFGTHRREDRLYNEEIYGGTGKSLHSATDSELNTYIQELDEENRLAYRPEDLPFDSINAEIEKLKKK